MSRNIKNTVIRFSYKNFSQVTYQSLCNLYEKNNYCRNTEYELLPANDDKCTAYQICAMT